MPEEPSFNATIVHAQERLSLQEEYPLVAVQWHPTKNGDLQPEKMTVNSDKKVWWNCATGKSDHEWEASIKNRTQRQSGCPHCYAHSFVSKGEKEITEVLDLLGVTYLTSNRTVLQGQEIDIYLPEYKVGIEYNGLYWHSEAQRTDKAYHQKKYELCRSLGVDLIQVWQDDWLFRRDIVIRLLLHKLGLLSQGKQVLPTLSASYFEQVEARNLHAAETTYKGVSEFLTAHHLQGVATGTKYFTLSEGKFLRAVLVVKRRDTGSWTIERYATEGIVQDGFAELLEHAESVISEPIKQWIAFSDSTVSNGKMYMHAGFEFDKQLPPDYTYVVKKERKPKTSYRKSRFVNDPKLVWQDGKSEKELAIMNGLYRIWDAGTVRWMKRLSPSEDDSKKTTTKDMTKDTR